MRVLITGGAGFIGSHIASALVAEGDDVRVFDNFSTGRRANLAGLPVEILEGDIRDRDAMVKAVEGVDTVFHLAALCSVAGSMEDPLTTHGVNATGTLTLLDVCRMQGVRRVVFSSSSAVYGDTETLPNHEHLLPAPVSPYGLSKLIGEHYCRIYWQEYGLETVALRYFNVFGARQNPDSEYAAVIPKFLDAILSGGEPVIYGDGEQTRDFTFVENVVQANILAAKARQAPGEVMNIACGERWNLLELLNIITDILNVDIIPAFEKPRQGEVKHSQACIARARKLIGFKPDFEFEPGLRKTIEWYRQSLTRPGPGRTVANDPGGPDAVVDSTAAEAKVINAGR